MNGGLDGQVSFPSLLFALTSFWYQAGRSPKLDEYARKFFSASPANRQSVYEVVKGLEEATIRDGEPYIRAMEKVLNGTTDYVEKELKRCADIPL